LPQSTKLGKRINGDSLKFCGVNGLVSWGPVGESTKKGPTSSNGNGQIKVCCAPDRVVFGKDPNRAWGGGTKKKGKCV